MKQSSISANISQQFKRLFPSPFTIALLITFLTFGLALLLTIPKDQSISSYSYDLLISWQNGLWDKSGGGLYFAFQMMLMLVLGHTLALTRPVSRLIEYLTQYCTSTANSAAIVAFSSIFMGLFNWGLGLIFGAILARRVGEQFNRKQQVLNYGLIGACAYLGLMVWHGGISGSAPTKAMETGAIQEMITGLTMDAPTEIPFETTIGSTMNIITSFVLLLLLPAVAYILGKKTKLNSIPSIQTHEKYKPDVQLSPRGAEKLDTSNLFGMFIGALLCLTVITSAITYNGTSSFGFIEPNFINLMLLGLSILLHRSITNFLQAIQHSIGDVSGILIQFPFYFGILGIMKGSGLIVVFSDILIDLSTSTTLPLFTFLSAGVVNFFVPSGGGQWAIQGPIILQSALELNASIPKTIMAMAYGDQLTNMLQPFWALPLLGITRLKAQDILPYTFVFFLVGLIIFGSVLLIF